MSGSVWRIEKRKSHSVRVGENLVILESMKMEIPIEAPVNGMVTDVSVSEGDFIQEGDLIMTVEEEDNE
ncbi:acetyl-CoA carboxylase biotin carboxyl carrier protein subunit [Alteribacter natronophilus]|nr:acetyl-CoA carboxylase biotin carboxyl carrier protein subunit [Alteribacter natronophilus]